MDSVMAKRENRQAVPEEMFSKEFLSQFKTEEDVSQFLKYLHSQADYHYFMFLMYCIQFSSIKNMMRT